MSTALALRLEFAMRSVELLTESTPDSLLRQKIESLRPLVDKAIEELS